MSVLYLALLVPIIVTAIFYYFKKREFTWWEFFIPIGSVLVAIIISKLIISYSSVHFTEYWGSTITAIYENEPYNYWKTETCSRQVPCGSDSKGNTTYCTEYYDCSHQEDVAPHWYAVTDIDESFTITEKLHDELVKQFGTTKTIVGSHKNYAPNDEGTGCSGTKFEGKRVGNVSYNYQTVWSGNDNTRKAYTSIHTYVNKIKASDLSVFNISVVSEKKADSLKLFKYPEYNGGGLFSMSQGMDYPTILGTNINKETQEKFKRLNGKFGVSNKMRLWVLIFENKPEKIAEYQENYWVKGNKNELVLCIGKKGNEIQWAHSFSWANSNVLTTAVAHQVLNLYTYKDSVIKMQLPPVNNKMFRNKLGKLKQLPPIFKDTTIKIQSPKYPVLTEKTWDDLYQYLNQNLSQFKKRTFKEFDYLTVEPSSTAIIIIYIIAFLISIAVNYWIITNDIYDMNDD
jgi:hypothetical protein